MTAVKTLSLDSPVHRTTRQKNLTPALSTLLSSTTIPCSRNKRRTKPQSKSPEDFGFYKAHKQQAPVLETLNFSKKAINPPQQQHSHIRSGLGSANSSRFSLSDDTLRIKSPAPIDSSDDEQDDDLLEFLSPSPTPLWQLHEDEQDEEVLSAASSFSSISSSTSSPGSLPTSFSPTPPRIVYKRRSLSMLSSYRSNKPSPANEHPLATEEEKVEEPKAPKKPSFMSQVTASIKAFTSAASALSASQQSLLSNSDVFAFSPRSTDEPIPRSPCRSMNLAPPVRRAKRPQIVKPKVSVAVPAAAAVPVANKPKVIALETYSVQEFALPTPNLRPRDIRENPDFLRIYSLEILMRKNGKLNCGGKAQVALLPRSDDDNLGMSGGHQFLKYQPSVVEVEGAHGLKKVPVRWVGVSVDDF